MAFFYRRSITDRSSTVPLCVVYGVEPTPGAKPDPVPVIGGFPSGWHPTELPGQCLADASTEARVFATEVPRRQFRHYDRISEAEALTLYPQLRR